MLARILALAAAVASVASAYQINSPTNTTVWSTSASTQSVQYESVSSDASTFAVVLVQNSQVVVTLETNVTKQDSATLNINAPGGAGWPTGDGFQVNFVKTATDYNSILAQSGRFSINNNGAVSSSSAAASSTSSASSSSSAASSASSSRSAASMSSGVVASASSAVAGDASGGIPNASAAPSGAAYALTSSNALMAGVIGLVGYAVGL